MTIAYFDCFAGISGDMTLGALVDAGGDPGCIAATAHALGLDDEVRIEIRHEQRGHVGGTRVIVHTENRTQRDIADLRTVIDEGRIADDVKRQARTALDLLAQAEARLHNHDASAAHLHELSGADTLIDLVGAFWLMQSMGVTRVYASALPAPRGRAGDMPLPAPASVRVLEGRGAVFEASDQSKELVTPTGAAILAVSAVFARPAMRLSSIGYGIGARDTLGNALAVWVGEEVPVETGVTMIETNLDDMAPDLLAALSEDLMAAGALDVTITPALMKKGRPGHLLAVIASPAQAAALTEHLLRHSTTLGVRITQARRVIADRRIVEIQTELGTARAKIKEIGGVPVDVAPEYEDCRRLAREHGRDLRDVIRLVAEAARKQIGL